jgi:hypothetical protein
MIRLAQLLTEIKAHSDKFDYKPLMKSLIEYMLENKMNIHPLPKVKFINSDSKNAEDFFGKTAYYNPDNSLITLYTLDRHPKDVMRSFAHEMVHHEQKCDGRIGDNRIKTQDINEDDYLKQIEEEAYKKGNIMLRGWTNIIKK